MNRIVGPLLVALLLAFALSAGATDVVKPFQSEADRVRYAFHYQLLDAVLARTVDRYGPYALQPYTAPISSARGHQEAIRGELLNLLISDAGHPIIDEGMIPIPYPLDKGLLGHRIALILTSNQARIERVNS